MAESTSRELGIWTDKTSRAFYNSINSLDRKVQGAKSPRLPVDYRARGRKRKQDAEGYILPYELELHLADHIAFMAHFKEGVEYVSAATVQQTSDPPGLLVTIASNESPKKSVEEGLNRILGVVREHAVAGWFRKNGEKHKTRLFEEIVSFSQHRIYGRIRTSQWKPPRHIRKAGQEPLSTRISQTLKNFSPKSDTHSTGIEALRVELIKLRDLLIKVERASTKNQINWLKEVVLQSFTVSNQGASRMLERYLREMKFPESMYLSRGVLEIDKLSKYREICNDLFRLSRQEKTRIYCMNLRLATCKAYPALRPAGAVSPCHVHGEVQLVLHYEKDKSEFPPRAIGSSKSACFLCDLFVKHHGRFGMSHSHMRLYPKWTIPDCNWLDNQQQNRLKGFIKGMTLEINVLLNKKFYPPNTFAESKTHILQIEQTSSIDSSILSLVLVERVGIQTPPANPELCAATLSQDLIVAESTQENTIDREEPLEPSSETVLEYSSHRLLDLPVTIPFRPVTRACTLVADKTEYFFDLSDVSAGEMRISDREISGQNTGITSATGQPVEACIDVRTLDFEQGISIQARENSQRLVFHIRSSQEHSLCVEITWE